MTIASDIDQFCSYFDSEVAAIGRLAMPESQNAEIGSGHQLRYRKTLYVTAIDTLAGLRFHKSAYPALARRNRERFVRFLEEFGSWPEGNLVSLPFTRDELEALKLLDRPLGQHVVAKIAEFTTEDGGAVPISTMDESFPSLLALATTEKEELAVNDYRHFALFYRYRNSLVHEARQPGNAMEGIFLADQPIYHGYIGDPRWYLLYPESLFESLLKQSIAGFRAYLTTNQINPYSLIEDRARW